MMNTRSVLIVEDDPEMRVNLYEGLSQNGYTIQLVGNGAEALGLFEKKRFDLVISDLKLPDLDGLELLQALKSKTIDTRVILMTGFGTIQNAVEAMKKGAYEYILKPFSLAVLEQIIQNALVEMAGPDLLCQSGGPSKFLPSIVTKNPKMKEILSLCKKIAPSKTTVLIRGESGTGKELFARYIHSHSQRSQGPYVAVNCASLPETLLESELFGHEKGAFTGAINKKIGKFELAHKGTILLDEISEMNPLLQAKILRVLQEGEVDRIGGRQPIPIDIRVVATTNRDLEAAIAKGEFREDLYYRLNVIPIQLPLLKERVEDIELLAQYFLKMFSEECGRPGHSISEAAMVWLQKQEWRGNVRELRNAIERAVLIANQPILSLIDFCPDERMESRGEGAGWIPADDPSSLSLRDMEEKLIFRALEKTNGNRTHAAKILGISIRTLRNKLHEYKHGLSSTEVA